MMAYCERCGGEGKLYTSKYGGNDPDVWATGECPACEGTGKDDSLRELFIRELRSAPSLDENGYICTKDEAIKAFDRALLGEWRALTAMRREARRER